MAGRGRGKRNGGRGREREKRDREGGEGERRLTLMCSWNRAADWLRPALLLVGQLDDILPVKSPALTIPKNSLLGTQPNLTRNA